MRKKTGFCLGAAVLWIMLLLLTGCSGENTEKEIRAPRTTVPVPENPGTVLYEEGGVSLDASNMEDGYIMVKYSGSAGKVKLQITAPEGQVCTYTLTPGKYETLPLTGGSGPYQVDVLENAYEDLFAVVFSRQLTPEIRDEFTPFLYPNQYVWYTGESQVVRLGISLSQKSEGDLDYVEQVYRYVTRNISYDRELAETVTSGYLPDADRTLERGKGICFDYASLMAALLRSQGIPTRLVVGYSGTQYHAWIDVYLEETGWVDKVIFFDGKSWSLMDPTLGAGNLASEVKKYVGDGTNYLEKFRY